MAHEGWPSVLARAQAASGALLLIRTYRRPPPVAGLIGGSPRGKLSFVIGRRRLIASQKASPNSYPDIKPLASKEDAVAARVAAEHARPAWQSSVPGARAGRRCSASRTPPRFSRAAASKPRGMNGLPSFAHNLWNKRQGGQRVGPRLVPNRVHRQAGKRNPRHVAAEERFRRIGLQGGARCDSCQSRPPNWLAIVGRATCLYSAPVARRRVDGAKHERHDDFGVHRSAVESSGMEPPLPENRLGFRRQRSDVA